MAYIVILSVGKSSNFAVVPARLIVDKKDHGIQMFIVQLRDRQTHQPLPGMLQCGQDSLMALTLSTVFDKRH